MFTKVDADRNVHVGVLGTARRVTMTATQVFNNATALRAGRWFLNVESGQVRVVGPTGETTAATATDTLLVARQTFTILTGSTPGTGVAAGEGFVSIFCVADAALTICGADPETAALGQPPDWT